MNDVILKTSNLKTYFFTRRGVVKAVDGVNFELRRGECLCLVGESGCGKTVTALSILGLIDSPPGKIELNKIRERLRGTICGSCRPPAMAEIVSNSLSSPKFLIRGSDCPGRIELA